MQRRVLIIALVLVAAAGFLISVNFVVTGMHRIMDIWYPGSISRTEPAPGPAPGSTGANQPFYISVDPQPEPAAPVQPATTTASDEAQQPSDPE